MRVYLYIYAWLSAFTCVYLCTVFMPSCVTKTKHKMVHKLAPMKKNKRDSIRWARTGEEMRKERAQIDRLKFSSLWVIYVFVYTSFLFPSVSVPMLKHRSNRCVCVYTLLCWASTWLNMEFLVLIIESYSKCVQWIWNFVFKTGKMSARSVRAYP